MCMYVVICKIDHCIHIHWCIPMGLGHNDLWVESHVCPQQMWGQRSSRGQWPLVQVFLQKSLYPHNLMYFHGTWTQWSLGRVTYNSLWATVAPHAPPGGFSETTIFTNLIHIAIGTRVPAKILMLDKAVRALFSKWLPKGYKCYNFIILKQICFIFEHCLEQKEYRIVQIWIVSINCLMMAVFSFKWLPKYQNLPLYI